MNLVPSLLGALLLLAGAMLTSCSLRAVALIETGDAIQTVTKFETGNANPVPTPSLP